MKLGEFNFRTPVCAAPMAGVSDKAFRLLARELGCDLVWTEMISATALTYKNVKTLQILDISGEQQPVVVQLFGSEPGVMAEAAGIAVAHGAGVIDINMGCPAPKVVKNCEGSALLKDLKLAGRVAAAIVNAVQVPVTVKMRLGWQKEELVAEELARILEDVGIAAITVHGRTRDQFYSGQADWDAIAAIKRNIKIPVIGNGDIWSPEDAKRMLELTGCDGVMIGRGSLGNPWIFPRTINFLKTGHLTPEPGPQEKLAMAGRHLDLLVRFKGENVAAREMRKHASWYLKGLRNAAGMRELIMRAKTPEIMHQLLKEYASNFENIEE